MSATLVKEQYEDEPAIENKQQAEGSQGKHNKNTQTVQLKYKIFLFVCAAFFSFGSHFAGISYGHLKTKLKKNLGWTNTEYGVTQAANDIPNAIFPFFAGMIYDYYGTAFGPLVTSLFLLLGTILSAVGLTQASFPLVTTGRLIYGLGTCSANVIQQMIIAKCFEGRNFATIFSLILSINRFGSFLGSVTMLPASGGDNLAGGTYLSACVCGISLLFTIFYLIGVKRMNLSSNATSTSKAKKRFSWYSVLQLPYTFWLLILVHFLLSGVQKGFKGIATDFYGQRDKTSDFFAANKTSISLGVSILLYPVLGKVMDRYGQRMYYVITACILSLTAFSLLVFTNITSYLMMVLIAVSISFKSLSLVTSIPSIVPSEHIGAAYALFRSAGSSAAAFVDAASGVIQDANKKDDYDEVMYMFVGITALAFVAAILWLFVDFKYYSSSMLLNRERYLNFIENKKRREKEISEKKMPPNKRKMVINGVCFVIYASAIIVWMYLFFTYLLEKKLKKKK